LDSIFDPFFTTKDNGTGLGLPLCLGIVENHGGSITVDNRPGRGAILTIELPLSAEERESGG
jgi:signal transduction histidine kinase